MKVNEVRAALKNIGIFNASVIKIGKNIFIDFSATGEAREDQKRRIEKIYKIEERRYFSNFFNCNLTHFLITQK